MVSRVQIGLLGLGVVGSGVLQALTERADLVAERCGRQVAVKRVLVRDTTKQRQINAAALTTNPDEVLEDPEIAVVVEMMGGEQPAFDYARRALATGKHLVTANKEMMAKHGRELLDLARERGVEIGFEASVGGGIPIIAALRRNLAVNRITSVRGILNGTTNHILTEMDEKGRDFAVALREAQALGYAEPDPTNDVEGFDSRYKLTILCALALGVWPRPEAIPCEGITRLDPADFRLAGELGYAIKLVAACRQGEGGLEAYVQPALVPTGSLLARVKGVFNAVALQGDMVGDMLFYGRGAGPAPTASAILADLVGIVRGERFPVLAWAGETSVLPLGETAARFYLRLEPASHSGGKAAIERLRELGIEVVASRSLEDGPLALLTSVANQKAITAAAADLASVQSIRSVAAPLRVVD